MMTVNRSACLRKNGSRMVREFNVSMIGLKAKIEYEIHYDAQDREIAMLVYNEEGVVNYKPKANISQTGITKRQNMIWIGRTKPRSKGCMKWIISLTTG